MSRFKFELGLIDRYIIKKYLSTFGFVVLMFSVVALAIDYSEKIEDFIKRKPSSYEIWVHYYLNFLPYINVMLFPLYALIAVIFFTSRMAYNSEVISMFNAGMSFRRLLRPYLVGGGLLALLQLVGNHYIIPISNTIRLGFEHKYIWTNSDKGKKTNVHMFLNKGIKVYVQDYIKSDSSIINFRIERFKGDSLVSMLRAERAEWNKVKKNWTLKNYSTHDFDGINERISSGTKMDTAINLRPSDFTRYLNQREMMTTSDLTEYITREEDRGIGNTRQFEVEKQRRTAEPCSIVILTIIGAAVASRKVRGGMGLHLVIGVALGAIYIFLTKMSVTFATGEHIPALLGVWIPNIVFSIVAYILIRQAQE